MPLRHGPGYCRVCGKDSGFTFYDVKSIERRTDTEPVTVVAKSVGVSPSSLYRHLANHRDKAQIVRDVRLDQDRSAFDLIDNEVDAYNDANRVRIEALAKGDYAVSLRAGQWASAIAKSLREQVGVDVTAERLRTHDADVLLQAIRDAAREFPIVAKALAKHADGETKRALTDLYVVACAQREN